MMIEIYEYIKSILVGNKSIDLFYAGTILIIIIWIEAVIISKLLKINEDSSLRSQDLYSIKMNTGKQVFYVCLLVFFHIFLPNTIIIKELKKYYLILFIFLSFINIININLCKRWHRDYDTLRKLKYPKEYYSYDTHFKNNNELKCNTTINDFESEIKCVTLKINILKHFITPTIGITALSYLNTLKIEIKILTMITDITILFFIIIVFLFWKYYKELKYYYKMIGYFKSTLYHIRNKLEYTEEERKAMQYSLFKPSFFNYKNR